MTRERPNKTPAPDLSARDPAACSQDIRNRGSSQKIRALTVTP